MILEQLGLRLKILRSLVYKVDEVKKINDQIVEISMSPVNKPLKYDPGQYIKIAFNNFEPRPFSIISSPRDPILKIAVKAFGDTTSKIQHVTVGSNAKIMGPFGNFFFLNYPGKKQIWIAGGIGITPFLSMSKFFVQAFSRNLDYEIVLFYCANNQNDSVYFNELFKLSKQVSNFKIIPFCADTHGFLSAQKIKELTGDLNEKEILMCGPPPMLNALVRQLTDIGVNTKFVHTEGF